MIRGIYWLIDGELLCFKDETFNHQRTWATLPGKIAGGVPYNHYPRGRVVIKNDKAVIYLNTHICAEAVITKTQDGRDCCDPTCLFFNKRGEHEFRALKHLSFRIPNFSPLLRALRYNGDLPEWEAPLKEISERVQADESLGDKLFDIGWH